LALIEKFGVIAGISRLGPSLGRIAATIRRAIMRKIIASSFLTFDGVMQAPGAPQEDPTGSFTLGGWSAPYWDDVMNKVMGQNMSVPFDLLLGRKTYEIFAAHWPHAGDNPITQLFNKATKYVASRTLGKLDWVNSKLLAGDAAKDVAQLKTGDGPDLQVHGSSVLLQSLIGARLIDEYRLWVFPVILGHGKRLFEKGSTPQGLSLVDTKSSSTGVLINTYRPAGALKPGSFALAEPSQAELARREKMAREG
jgi:dihydrofolate reductase